jgi:predicted PurR-regulated permease PerM
MKGYGHLLWWTFPFVMLGLVLTILRLKKPEYRILLLALLTAPAGASLVAASITRALFMVIPAAFLAALALDQIVEWLSRLKIRKAITVLFLFITLAGTNGYMLYDALVNGPTWYQNYNLYGMQFGARQVFGAIKEYLSEHPQDKLFLASGWTNGTDVVAGSSSTNRCRSGSAAFNNG